MSSVESTETFVRVESGEASAEEFAVLVTLFTLLARSGEPEEVDAGADQSQASWTDRSAAFRAPHSWR